MLRLMLTLLVTLSLTGCLAASPDGICDGLSPLVDAHAAALVADGGDQSVVTGNRLIAGFDAACP